MHLMLNFTRRLFLQASLATTLLSSSPSVFAEPVAITKEGASLLKIVTAETATPETKEVAGRLGQFLERISGAKFQLETGDGSSGIAVGLPGDFASQAGDIKEREEYVLKSHARGIHVIGATPLALTDASWDFLHRLGYRQFFPGQTWEVVPSERNLSLDVDAHEKPAYLSRRIWYGFGGWDFARQPYRDWCSKNRAVEGFDLNTGHAYDGIVHRHEKEFAEHPEYRALVKGERKGTKMCISNPALRKLVIDDSLAQSAKNPQSDSISMDPSDGGGWCECPDCAKVGSVSDQALYLANEVAAAVNVKYPGRFVGMYAYNFHSPPPTIRAHPQVVISVATAFIKGGATIDELIGGWAEKGAKLGIREYYSVNTWDRDLPGAARGGNPEYLARTIPKFASQGAKFLSAESSDNWAPNGLGYYLAARMMWDPLEAENVNGLRHDFLTRAFGPAREAMGRFYEQLDGSKPHLVQADQLGRMFRALDEARKPGLPAEVQKRVDALTLYAHYVHLYHTYESAKESERQTGFEALIRHAYRMRDTFMIHSQALYRDLASRDKSVKVPADAGWKVPEGKNPWKSSEPFSPAELTKYVEAGIAANSLSDLNFEPVKYSDDLVSAAPLALTAKPIGDIGTARGTQTFYTYLEKPESVVELNVTGGLIAHYRDRGPVKLALWKIGGESDTGENETLVTEDRSALPDGTMRPVRLQGRQPGLYKITADDGKDMTRIELVSQVPWTVKSSKDQPMNRFYSGPWLMYFYVPKGTPVIGFFGGEHGEIRDSNDRPLFWLNGREPNFYSVTVPEGEDGKLWSVRYGRGSVRLLTVPPFFARSAAELLLPSEVVKRDAPQK